MTSAMPGGAAVPGPDDLPPEQRPDHQQPDPFGDPSDRAGRPADVDDDDIGNLSEDDRERGD